jgi:hypothetical protein
MPIELVQTINEIVKYGIEPNLAVIDRDKLLEKNLVKIIALRNCYSGKRIATVIF